MQCDVHVMNMQRNTCLLFMWIQGLVMHFLTSNPFQSCGVCLMEEFYTVDY